jgi:hypothetical protein
MAETAGLADPRPRGRAPPEAQGMPSSSDVSLTQDTQGPGRPLLNKGRNARLFRQPHLGPKVPEGQVPVKTR